VADDEGIPPQGRIGLNEPGPSPLVLSGRQRAVLEGLVSFGPKEGPRELGPLYQGVLSRLAQPAAPDCAAQAAHGARELMEKLAWWVNDQTPEDTRGSLGDRADEIQAALDQASDELPPDRALWSDARITPGVLRMLDAVEHMSEWRRSFLLDPGDYAVVMVDFCLGSRLPEHLRVAKRKEWRDLRDFFVAVAHHRRHGGVEATPDTVAEHFAALEDFLYARWAPQTVRDFGEIDSLIDAEGRP
jgi:hypothetical protein